ncbi:lipoprotein [Ferruginibacter paludis]
MIMKKILFLLAATVLVAACNNQVPEKHHSSNWYPLLQKAR